jgi:hypothetical protein
MKPSRLVAMNTDAFMAASGGLLPNDLRMHARVRVRVRPAPEPLANAAGCLKGPSVEPGPAKPVDRCR